MVARFNTLAQWLAWQETHHPSAIDLGLGRVKVVAERLGVLKPSARVITIAGTNGKGSCVCALEALLEASGKSYGAYTSPHLLHYNERVRLAGKPVSDAQLCEAFARIDDVRGDISLTYFEFGTLAAMDIFNREPLDYWLMEIGLGGRLDAVNIVAPTIAVLTSVAIDHEAWLGNTREKIGREKVGICRQGIPFVCAEPNPPHTVIEHAQALACKALWLGQDYSIDELTIDNPAKHHLTQLSPPKENEVEASIAQGKTKLQLTTSQKTIFDISAVNLPKASVAAAIEVCLLEDCLPSNPIATLTQATLVGRMQKVQSPKGVLLLDVAHNPASAQLLANELKRQNYVSPRTKIPAVLAMMADKNIVEILSPLLDCVEHWYCADLPNNERAAKAADIAAILFSLGVPKCSVTCGESVASMIDQWALEPSQDPLQDPLLVFGSFFTVAAALEHSA